MPPPPLDETIAEGQLGHIDDHEYVADWVNTADVVMVRTDDANVFTAQQSFSRPTGTAFLADGNLVASGGGEYFRSGTAIAMSGGTNGTRGDSIVSDAPQNADGSASFFINHVASGTFATKGSHIVFYAVGTHAPLAGGGDAYGEHAGFVSFLTAARLGGLTEGYEAIVHVTAAGRTMGFVSVMRNDAALTYWCRGFHATSIGTQPAGDAYYAEGGAGWANFLHFKGAAGSQRFRVDNTGKMYIGAGARTFYDDGSVGLKTDDRLTASSLSSGAGGVYSAGYHNFFDDLLVFGWVNGDPNGAIAQAVGSIVGDFTGAAGTGAYVKSTGAATSSGWQRVLTSAAAKPTGTPAAATDLATVITLANNLRASLLTLALVAS